MKYPKNAKTRPTDARGESARIISDENVRYHDAAYGLKRPVVMAEMPVVTGGHNPGEHDGIRDGYAAPNTSWLRVYASLEDWLAAGNEDPRK